MSFAKVKAKGKAKALPKLKAILANPIKTRCPILDEAELEQLKHLLQNAIQESKLEARVFATEKGICLGLESSLRKINNQTSSCVFISLSIKPNYIISLIARNATTKDETQPIYAQPKLENFIKEVFGINALCMVFSKEFVASDEKIEQWVMERRKNVKKNIPLVPNKMVRKILKKPKLKSDLVENNEKKSEYVGETSNTNSEVLDQVRSGDFISFEHSNNYVNAPKLEGDEAVYALKEIIDNIPTSAQLVPKIVRISEAMEEENIEDHSAIRKDGEETDSDDFLGEYKSVTVHKIKGNPNKKPKKKRKKNKNKNAAK